MKRRRNNNESIAQNSGVYPDIVIGTASNGVKFEEFFFETSFKFRCV